MAYRLLIRMFSAMPPSISLTASHQPFADLDSTESPPLASIEVRPGEKTGPLTLIPPPDACSDRYALPASPDRAFPATNNEDYRMRLGCK